MTKRNRIIVSIVGITIVLLALLGITYAYYLTRIEGNTNTNSISITTADLKLSYSDGNGIVEKTNFMPGDSITKTFSVENTGENKVQGYTIVLEDVVNELTRREDLKYDLICTLDDGTSCGKSENNLYPKTKNIAIIYSNDIDSGIKHNYELVVNYIYLETIDQSDDMGSNISGKVNIYDAKDDKLNPFKTGVSATDNKSLAYNIIENARLGKNGTNLTGTPLTMVSDQTSLSSFGKYEPEIYPLVKDSVNGGNLYTYSDDYTISSNGKFSLVNPQTLIYSESYDLLKSKYIVSIAGSSTEENSSNIDMIYKVSPTNVSSNSFDYVAMNKYISNESVLATTTDDYGISYYYRGGVKNNYLNFAGMCWRIVRIQGDGSIKLILEDQDEGCSELMNANWRLSLTVDNVVYNTVIFDYSQYDVGELVASDGSKNTRTTNLLDYLHGNVDNYISLSTALRTFQQEFSNEELSKMVYGGWCFDDKPYLAEGPVDNYAYTLLDNVGRINNIVKDNTVEYSSYVRLIYPGKNKNFPTLKCQGKFLQTFEDDNIEPTLMYVGALSADEVVYAGGVAEVNSYAYYLVNDFQRSSSLKFWTMTPTYYDDGDDGVFIVSVNGKLADLVLNNKASFRPVINLKSDITISSGDGTINNPYVVE